MSLESKRKSPPVSTIAEYLVAIRNEWGTTRTIIDHLEMFLNGRTFHIVGPVNIETLTNVKGAHFIYMYEISVIEAEYGALRIKISTQSESLKLRTSSKASKIQ